MERAIKDMLDENARRRAAIGAVFNPVTGEGSTGARVRLRIADFALPVQWVPREVAQSKLVRRIVRAGSIGAFLESQGIDDTPEARADIDDLIVRVRCLHDFPFWAAVFVVIKGKGGDEQLFRLNRPQRRLIERFEARRTAGEPIRLILLKARQWGGSTATQIYMAWLQLVHKRGLNSLIVGHVKDTAVEVKDMFHRMLDRYPAAMLHGPGENFPPTEEKMTGVAGSLNISRIPSRRCKVKIGTAEKPDGARGGDYSLVHCTEVGLWRRTEGKTPEQIVRSATSGILLKPYTMIVYESTANGTGNFFQKEYDAAKKGRSQFEAMFVAWWQIEQYEAELRDTEDFARRLWLGRQKEDTPTEREEPGRYLWKLWQTGATLEAIAWYVEERRKYHDHGDMASEYPSDDVEAFVHSGNMVFDQYRVDAFRSGIRPPKMTGDVCADGDEGKAALTNIRFEADGQGWLRVWQPPEEDDGDEIVTNRYLAVVDVGGRGAKADWSVVVVIDRLDMMNGGQPIVVAQWYGHTDMDRLAWKAAQIAAWYDNALLVIESNTLETKDRDRTVDGDQSQFILNQLHDVYPNLYARRQSEEEITEHAPRRYGFHTNVATKPMIISTLVKAVREHLYIERDERCLNELLTYERKPNGSFGAVSGKHDDLLMTRAIGLHICFNEMPIPEIRKRENSLEALRPKHDYTEATW